MLPISMEFFEAMSKGATEGSKRKLDEADMYLGIFAHRYGYIEDGYEASVTECEFDYAGERGLDRLCFLIQPDYTIAGATGDESHRERLQAFKQRIERKLIRSQFTTMEDFRGKLRIALQEWKEGDAKARLPQPTLTSNLLEPNDANRLTYRARQSPFVGRQRERAALERFLADAAQVSWLVVSGPGGSGKSRLVQEFCLTAGPEWRAGFLAPKQSFDWTTWQPNLHTLIAVDYAAERVDELRALLNGLLARPDRGARIRVLLVEREANGAWMQELVGRRSDGYATEQIRFAESPLVLGPLSEEELWETVRGVLRAGATALPSKTEVLQRLHDIDPDGRPLFAAFAAEALLSGRDLREWDRDRLLRDVLERERQSWASKGVPESYENLLALATAVGGDTEQILEAAADDLQLPSFREFARALYNVMTGCEPEGNDVPALKPDMLGEFFVLEHVRGRNDRITAMQAAELAATAWRIRGGSKRSSGFMGITHVSPSSLILFLSHLVEDFPDHPSTRYLLRKPQVAGVDLQYWATLVSIGIRRYAIEGNIDAAQALFDELSAMHMEELGR